MSPRSVAHVFLGNPDHLLYCAGAGMQHSAMCDRLTAAITADRDASDVDFQRAILADRRDAEDELAKVAGLVRGSTNGTYTDVEFETLALAWLAEFDASHPTGG